MAPPKKDEKREKSRPWKLVQIHTSHSVPGLGEDEDVRPSVQTVKSHDKLLQSEDLQKGVLAGRKRKISSAALDKLFPKRPRKAKQSGRSKEVEERGSGRGSAGPHETFKKMRQANTAEDSDCKYLCLDNLGGGISKSQLHEGLVSMGIKRIKASPPAIFPAFMSSGMPHL